MKVIDLLNKIANKEEVPKKIEYECDIWIYDEQMQDYYYKNEENGDVFWLSNSFSYLNDEIEIIEEKKKIEKLGHFNIKNRTLKGLVNSINVLHKDFEDKINELVDVINEMRDK